MQPVELDAIIEAALESQRPAADAKGVHLRAHRPGAISVRGDAGRLQQVVLNLLSNAIKFTPAGGRIDVTVEQPRHDAATISVRDTGEGISPEFLPYVFDRFRQADGTSTRTHMGLGLGLAIVRHVVELHGGSVQALSGGHGLGATFTVTLPTVASTGARRVKAPAAVEPSGFDRASGVGVQVLVVEDDRETREMLSVILERTGYSHRVAAGAKDALALLDDWLPDVIVSDIGMPGMDGYEFIRAVRSRPREKGGQLPALALSAYVRSEDRQLALASGYQAHVSKPVDPAALLGSIAELVEAHCGER
jgi:CheY-like chemotaxis protein